MTNKMDPGRTEVKLGIVVVYMVPDENERLLNLHLDHIAKHTRVPYRIYGYANKLSPSLHAILTENEHVCLVDIPPFARRGKREHSYYLEHLIEAAIQDGVTHVVTLHVDSFPIKTGWAEELVGRVSGSCVLASINDAFTACMFFPSSFYRDYQPSFLLADEVETSPDFQEYANAHGYIAHSGIGFLYMIDRKDGISWYPLTSENGRVYGGLIFHFRNAVLRNIRRVELDTAGQRATYRLTRGVTRFAKGLKPYLPAGTWSLLPGRAKLRRRVRAAEMTEVVEDFDEYFARLKK